MLESSEKGKLILENKNLKSSIEVLAKDLDQLNEEIEWLKNDLSKKNFYTKYHKTWLELASFKKEFEELIDVKFKEQIKSYQSP